VLFHADKAGLATQCNSQSAGMTDLYEAVTLMEMEEAVKLVEPATADRDSHCNYG